MSQTVQNYFSEHPRSLRSLRLRRHPDKNQPQLKDYEEQILFDRKITQQVIRFSPLCISHDLMTQVPDSLRSDPAHRNDCQVWQLLPLFRALEKIILP